MMIYCCKAQVGAGFILQIQIQTPRRPEIMMTRRQAMKTGAFGGIALATLPGALAQTPPAAPAATAATGPFTVPPLPYAYDALEPYIDARTMEIHHDKHHGAYVANLNKAVAEFPEVANKPVEDMLRDLNSVPEKIRTTVRNNGGGHFNHSLFWQMLKMDGGEPTGELAKAMGSVFGNFSKFKENFSKAATSQFGSGWAWLVINSSRQLSIEASPNQDSPISQGNQPLLGIDIWEHAYYLKYQNKRADYVKAFFTVVNWDYVSGQFAQKA
jgi:Fe-Mn family superoxide dismutase